MAEFLIYSNYIPFQLTEGIFPVPPIGEEFTDAYVPPMKSKIKYEKMYGEMVEKEEYGCTPPAWKEELTEKCKTNLQKSKSRPRLPRKKYWIKSASMKHWMTSFMLYTNFLLQLMLVSIVFGSNTKCQDELFNAWPTKFYKEAYLMTRILLCDTLKRYDELLDEIFNIKFIERAMQLKAMVDCQIMAIHPHMAKIIAFFDLMIYRYYSPVWNRNAEGKLQALEEEEEEEDGGDNDDDDNNRKEKKEKMNWIQMD